jgi:hypothetical protein
MAVEDDELSDDGEAIEALIDIDKRVLDLPPVAQHTDAFMRAAAARYRSRMLARESTALRAQSRQALAKTRKALAGSGVSR